SAALVSKTGSIVWCCLPEFDSSSIFAKLLDEKIGGSFDILVDESYTVSQSYLAYTGILITTFSNGSDIFEVRDFMPRYRKENGGHHTPPEIVRFIKLISGRPSFRVKYDPKLEYAIDETFTYVKPEYVIS